MLDRKRMKSNDSTQLMIISFLTLYAVQIVSIMVMALLGKGNELISNKAFVLSSLVVIQLTFLFTTVIFSKKKELDIIPSFKYKKRISAKQAFMLIAVLILTLAAFLPITMLFMTLMKKTGWQPTDTGIDDPRTFGQFILMLFITAFMPALCEETLFRSGISEGYKQRGYIFSIFLTSILFSLMHGTPQQLVYQFFLSAVITYVFLITSSFWSAFLLHFLNNGSIVLFSYFMNIAAKNRTASASDVADNNLAASQTAGTIGVLLVSIVAFILLVLLLRRFTIETSKQNKINLYLPTFKEIRSMTGKRHNFFSSIIIFMNYYFFVNDKNNEEIIEEEELDKISKEEQLSKVAYLIEKNKTKMTKRETTTLVIAIVLLLIAFSVGLYSGYER